MTEQNATKMSSERFREPLNRTFEQWQRSFPFDARLLPQEVAASKAHARTIAAAGVRTKAELAQTLEGLDHVLTTTGTDYHAVVAATPEAEDIHHFDELQLTKAIGPLALKLHTGRSRNEQIATDMRLFVREAIDATITGLHQWQQSLITLAEQAGENVMPSYTHLQRAEPVLIAHWLLAYVSMIERDLGRLADARKRMNLCPLGFGAIAGATLALGPRHRRKRELGFDAPTPNSAWTRPPTETSCPRVHPGHHRPRPPHLPLRRGAQPSTPPPSSASSTSPKPSPPAPPPCRRRKTPTSPSSSAANPLDFSAPAVTLATLIKGLPLAYNKDLQEGQEPDLRRSRHHHRHPLRTSRLHRAPSSSAPISPQAPPPTTGYLNAMAAATYLSSKGVPFRKAHEIIGNAVRLGLESGRELHATYPRRTPTPKPRLRR